MEDIGIDVPKLTDAGLGYRGCSSASRADAGTARARRPTKGGRLVPPTGLEPVACGLGSGARRIPQRPTRPVPSLLAGLRARRLPRTSQRTRAMPASLLHWCCTDRRGSSRRRRPPSAWVSRCPRSTACARRAPCPASDWAPFGASTSRASSLAATACASSQGPVARGRSRAPRRPASLPDRRVHAESRADAASGCPSGPGCPPQASRRRSPARSAYQRRACLASSRASGWNSSRFIAEPTRELLRRERLDLAGIDLGRPTRDLCVPRRRCSHVFGLVQARQQGCREVRPIARPQPQRLGKHLLLGGHIVSIEPQRAHRQPTARVTRRLPAPPGSSPPSEVSPLVQPEKPREGNVLDR